MIILQSKAKQGKSLELIKRFIQDDMSTTLVTDELTFDGIHDIINKLMEDGYEINYNSTKHVITGQFTNCNADYYKIISDNLSDNLYLDLHIPKSAFDDIKRYCKDLENEYGCEITLVEQLGADSNILGVNAVEY